MTKTIADIVGTSVDFEILGDIERLLKGVAIDSREVKEGYLFAARKGTAMDGHLFIDQAIHNGAVAVCCEQLPETIRPGVTYLKVNDMSDVLPGVVGRFYDFPSRELKLIGVTGTNGKTTVTSLAYNLFKDLGYSVGLISTIEILINDRHIKARLTTPDIVELNDLLSQMVKAGCDYVFMEVSSHAIDQGRIAGLNFTMGVFTNLTRDHLDYHGSFKEYIYAKKKFFDHLERSSLALVNVDDGNGEVMVQSTRAQILRYSMRSLVDFKGKILSNDNAGLELQINDRRLISKLSGAFNGYNLLAVYGIASSMEIESEDDVLNALSKLKPVRGRFDMVLTNPMVVVDYAHTPDALENVLKTLKSIGKGRAITTIVGCGGNRDQGKRPVMAAIAVRYSGKVVLTSDNPRYEDPVSIINDMMKGVQTEEKEKVIVEVDRKLAIESAIDDASRDDIILIAGKGHEEYQEIRGERTFFSDHNIVRNKISEDI